MDFLGTGLRTGMNTGLSVGLRRTLLLGTVAGLAFTFVQTGAFAQDTGDTETAVAEDADLLESDTIVVKGFRGSFARSIQDKRNAPQVVDTISAEEIGLFPDQNITEALQRITGVSITRANGEGETVGIRGLDPVFTRVEIDGRTASVTIDSANPGRESTLSVFASELYDTVEVIKSPTAADIEGGIGGIVRLSTPNPLDIAERRFGVNASITEADTRNEVEPAVDGYYIDNFFNETLGVLISGTYEDRRRDIDKIQSNQDWREVNAGFLADSDDPALQALIGGRYPGRLRQEQRTGEAPKYNINAKVHYRPAENFEFFVNGLYTLEERDEDRSRIQVDFRRGQLEGGTLGSGGTLTEATFTRQRTEFRDFTRIADIETYGITGGFEWELGKWLIESEASFFSSEEDFDEFRVDHRTNRDGLGGYSIKDDPQTPVLFTPAAELAPEDVDIRLIRQQRRIISIEEESFRADVKRGLNFGALESLTLGFRFASTEFDRRQGNIDADDSGLTYADGGRFVVDGEFGDDFGSDDLLRRWPSTDPVKLFNIFPPEGNLTFDDQNFFTLTEEVLSGYYMTNFDTSLFGLYARGNAGARIVHTDVRGEGRVTIETADDVVVLDNAPALEASYTEVLPAFNIVLSQNADSDLLVRGAITRALSRPTIDELNPSTSVNFVDAEVSRGNPDLDPFLAWQYDLGVEYYFGETDEGLMSAAFFYKDVSNFITPTQTIETIEFGGAGIPAQEYQVSSFENGGDATIFGVEVSLQTPFFFLPGFWSDFGIFANYTYTNSEFTTATGQTFDFPGASEHAYNLVGYYEWGGFSGRLAYTYRDDFLIVPNSPNAQFGDSDGRLDLALRYRFENGVRLSFDALNLTEEQNYKYYDTTDRLEDFEFEGRIYTFSIGFIY